MSQQTKEKKSRTAHRSYTRKLIHKAGEVCNNYDGTKPGEIKLEGLKRDLSEKLTILDKLDNSIIETVDEEKDIEAEINESSEFRSSIHEAISQIDLCLQEHKVKHNGGHDPNGSLSSSSVVNSSYSDGKQNVRLPKLNLKHFKGDPIKFQAFWDSFETTIHNNEDVSDVSKMSYLVSLLEGPAYSAVAGLSLTSANYKTAVDTLKERFGCEEVVISAHMDALLKLSGANTNSDTKKLRGIYDEVEQHVRGLKAVGISSKQYGKLLVPILMNKIPQELQLIITRKLGKEKWDLDALQNAFKEELEAREMCEFVTASKNDDKGKGGGGRRYPTTAETLLAQGQYERKGSGITCTYCRGSHPSAQCHAITDVQARREVLKSKGKCYNCLRAGHISYQCQSTTKCYVCGYRHHISICPRRAHPSNFPKKNDSSQSPPGLPDSPKSNPTATVFSDTEEGILLQTATAPVCNPRSPEKIVSARILFDSGSQKTYISKRLKDALGLSPLKSDRLIIKTFGTAGEMVKTCEEVQVSVQGNRDLNLYLTAHCVPIICAPLQNQRIEVAVREFPHLEGLELADSVHDKSELEVDLLVGSDFYWQFMTGRVQKGEAGPTAIESHLGWILSGPSSSTNAHSVSANLTQTHVLRIAEAPDPVVDPLREDLSKFWSLESMGIQPNDEYSVHEQFLDNIETDGERYQVKLPFKQTHPILPDNYQNSVMRLGSLVKRLRSEPELLREYDNILKEQKKTGVIEDAPEGPVSVGEVYYIPHHCVVRQDKDTTRVRVVYDASAESKGISLNNCLHSGPCLVPTLFDIMLRFRCHLFALVADIEKAFLQIEIAPEHRDFLRFLWIDDICNEQPNIIVQRMTRVTFGVTASPFLLAATLQYHIAKYYSIEPKIVDNLLRSFYVDDLASGEDSYQKTYELYERAKSILQEGGFTLRKWATNNSDLRSKINQDVGKDDTNSNTNEDESTYAKATLGSSSKTAVKETEQKVLGLLWNPDMDVFIIRFQDLIKAAESLPATKRSILKIVASVYDPMGFISPVILPMKMLFQQLCIEKGDWDAPLTSQCERKWQGWITELRKIPEIKINRCCIEKNICKVELHGFSDASKGAFAAVTYLRIESKESVKLTLIAAKTRVAPLKQQSLPRLELLGALCLARLVSAVRKAIEPVIPISAIYYWTDSITTLYWIQGTSKEFKQFVENRLSEIRELSGVECWRHVPGKCNPADLPSRGVRLEDLADNSLWWNGPTWLHESEEHWPQFKNAEPDEAAEKEMKLSERSLATSDGSTHVSVTQVQNRRINLELLIDPKRYSSSLKLYRVTALVVRFVKILKHNCTAADSRQRKRITTDEIKEAEVLWFQTVQRTIIDGRKFSQVQRSLGLYSDDSKLLRCKGRISQADIPTETKNPIILPNYHHLTSIIIRECHERVLHNGVQDTLCCLRERFWIVKGRQTVKRVIGKCVTCRKFEGKAYTPPTQADLPKFRVTQDFPFSHVGVDFAGPIYVKSVAKGQTEMTKAYIALYTCASTRAVHLELVPNLTADAFIRSFRRFISRRGIPKLILSDNAKTFKSSSNKLSALLDLPEVQELLQSRRVEWKFIVEKAPWWGGFWERMVKSSKRCLKKTLKNARLSYDELNTVLTEVESVLNSRPLTYVESGEMEEALTPSHLLMGRRSILMSNSRCERETVDMSGTELTKRAKYLCRLTDSFWKKWHKEYLLSLREQHRGSLSVTKETYINIGDVVSVHDENRSRAKWRLARVHELIRSTDGKIRAAIIRIAGDSKKSTYIRRPVQKLFPLELRNEHTQQDEKEDRRSRRKAAIVGEIKRRCVDK